MVLSKLNSLVEFLSTFLEYNSENFRCSQAFWLLKQCRWRLQNVQKRQSQIVQLWHKTALKVAEGMHKQYNGNMMSNPQVVVKATATLSDWVRGQAIGICSRHFANASIRLYHDERFLNQKTSLLN